MATMTPTINPELVSALKRLRLGRIVDTLPDRLVLADKLDMSVEELLLLLLTDEIARRDGAAAEIRGAEPGMSAQVLRRSVDRDASGFEHIGAIGDAEGRDRVMLDEENRDALFLEFMDDAEHLRHHERRQSHRRFVEEH